VAPEQLEGHEAGARTDIFAFGAVLYEMVTGHKAFEGRTHASLIAAILERQPRPLSALQPLSPPALDRVIRGCLAKVPDERWQSVADMMKPLAWVAEGTSDARGIGGPSQRKRPGLTWLAGALVVVVGVAAGWVSGRSQAISPDGLRIAFLAQAPTGVVMAFVRALDSPTTGFRLVFHDANGFKLFERPVFLSEVLEITGAKGEAIGLDAKGDVYLDAATYKRLATWNVIWTFPTFPVLDFSNLPDKCPSPLERC
jgi:hypothetical protein